MNREQEPNSGTAREDIGITLAGQYYALIDVHHAGGIASIETEPGSGKFLDLQVTPSSVDLRPRQGSPFFFRAEVVAPGEVGIKMMLKDASGNRDLDMPRGRELARVAIMFFDDLQIISGFTATWKEGGDNFVQFLHGINIRHMSNEAAAFSTWTGINIAKPLGFTQIAGIFKDMHSDERFVIVKFVRPRAEVLPNE